MTVPAAASGRSRGLAVATVVARESVVVLGLAVALAAASRIVLPLSFTPVPVSAQTFVVLVAGALLGARRAGAGGLTYLAFGVAGVPWFAVTGGATLGYIAGFALAGWLVGRAADAGLLERRRGALAVMAGAHLTIYVLGATVLALVVGVGAPQAFALGVAPFLLGDTLKVVAAASIAPALVRTGRSLR
jgi:biotin transport system substrate-specific component